MIDNRKYLKIGNKILEGPRAIFPPDSGHDWMEKDLSIYIHYHGHNRIQHISLWSDSTMNKEANFLNPVIRFVHWEKQNDLEKARNKIEISWPDINLLLGYIKPDCFNKLNSEIIEVQKLIPKIHFIPQGISLCRDVVTIESTDLSVDYEIWIRNGIQSICHYSPLIDNDMFSNKIIELKNLLLQSMDKLDHSSWIERYDSPFDISSYDWDYKINGR